MGNALPFTPLREEWSEATLSDGTNIRFRGTLTGVIDDGPGKLDVRLGNQFQAFAPEDKQRAPRPRTKRLGPVEGLVSGKAISIYEVPMGFVRVVTVINRLYRTDGYDGNGEPIFDVEANMQMQVVGAQPPPQPPTQPQQPA